MMDRTKRRAITGTLAVLLAAPVAVPARGADPTPATGSFTLAAPLGQARGGHTATLLPDGRVLVVGGDADGTLASAELWDAISGAFGPAGSLAEARSDHTATLLPDGRVLVVSGVGDDGLPLASAELYDPNAQVIPSPGPSPGRAADHRRTAGPVTVDAIGAGTTTDRQTPVQVSGLDHVTAGSGGPDPHRRPASLAMGGLVEAVVVLVLVVILGLVSPGLVVLLLSLLTSAGPAVVSTPPEPTLPPSLATPMVSPVPSVEPRRVDDRKGA